MDVTLPVAALTMPVEADVALATFLQSQAANLTPEQFSALSAGHVSPVARSAERAELLYTLMCAATGQTKLEAAYVCHQITGLCVSWAWHEIGQTPRGLGVMLACRRVLGDASVTQTPDQDPAPSVTAVD